MLMVPTKGKPQVCVTTEQDTVPGMGRRGIEHLA